VAAILALAFELHVPIDAQRTRAGLLIADVADAGLAMEPLLLIDAASNSFHRRLSDTRGAAVVRILPVATQAGEDEILQELVGEIVEVLGPVCGNETRGTLGASNVGIDLVVAQGGRRGERLVKNFLKLALALGTGRGDSHGKQEEDELHLWERGEE